MDGDDVEMADLDRIRAALAGRYEVQHEVGSGGMAVVYLAHDVKHDRPVAVKVLRPSLAAAVGGTRFLQEIKIAANLNHPNIVPLHDSGEVDGLLYYVMPYVEGESLRDRLTREKQLTVPETMRIARDVAGALSYAHTQRVVHRDIKPGNILLSSGRAVVTDFGIARAVSDVGPSPLTTVGLTVGTPSYMSPEQAGGSQDVDGRSDLYSLGCVIFEMLVGEPPYQAATPQVILAKQVGNPQPLVRTVRPNVGESIDDLLAKLLATIPADRFATADDFLAAVDGAAGPRATAPTPKTRWRRLAPLGGALAIGGIVLFGGVRLLGSSPAIPFEERDQVLVTDLENTTGEAIFDQSLETALSIGLQQSRHVTVFPRARIPETLRLIGGGTIPDSLADATLDEALARDIAQRERLTAVIVPSISRLDSLYGIALRVVDPVTGDILLSYSARAAGRADVMSALDDLTRQLRRDLGESVLSVAQSGVPLDRATTSSLEALKSFSDGRRAHNAGQPEEALTLFLRAIELDSNFAMAHKGLALYYYWNRSDRVRGDYHYEKALALRDRLTDLERLSIRADGAFAREDFEDAATTYRIYLSRYPEDLAAWSNLGLAYMRLRRYDQAIPTFREALSRDPTRASLYVNLATTYTAANQLDSAIATYHAAFEVDSARRFSSNINHEYGFTLVRAGMADSAAEVFSGMLSRSRADQANGHRSLALLDMKQGRYREALTKLREAVVLTRALELPTSEMRNLLYVASGHRLIGQRAQLEATLGRARQVARDESIDPFWLALLAKLYVRSGMIEEAEDVARLIGARRDTTRVNHTAVHHLVSGELALARGSCADALPDLELAYALIRNDYFLESLAYCHLSSNELDRAADSYEQIASNQSLGWEAQEYWLLSHYYLGTISEAQGDTTAAIDYYNRFLDMWADGDVDIAEVMDARQRLRRLIGPG